MRTDAPVQVWSHVLANIRLGLLHTIPVLLIVSAIPSFAAIATFSACSDGIDNDTDGQIDYPQDTQCAALEDNSEGATGQGVFLSITDGKDTVKAGGSLIYRVTLTSDRDDQRDVDVRLLMPHQTNYLSASNGGYVDGAYVAWDNVTVQRGTQRSLTVNLEVNPYAQDGLLIVAKVSAAGETATDTTKVNNSLVTVAPSSLKISITDDRQTAEPQETLHYRIRVENTGNTERTFTVRASIPVQLAFINASGNGDFGNNSVDWTNVTLAPSQSRELTFDAKIEDHLSGFYPIVTKAFIPISNEKASDNTFVHYGPLESDFGITVKALQQEAERGQNVSFEIKVTNRSTDLATHVDVTNALPSYTEFVSASEGGRFTGANEVRFEDLTISPKGSRTLLVTARVRGDAPLDSTLINRAQVKNTTAGATTDVVLHAKNVPVRTNDDRTSSDNVLLRKTADRSEVTPGDTISYTVTLRNTTGKTLRNLEVVDRLDASYMTLVGGATDAVRVGNRLTWTIDELAPNAVWNRSYAVLISSDVPSGINLNNIVTVGGDDISSISLTQRVQTAQLGIVGQLPQTGVGMDSIFVSLSGLLGIGQLVLQRRKIFA